MYCHGMGQHRKHEQHNYTDLVCMAVPREFWNVTEDKQLVTPNDLLKGNNFWECESRLLFDYQYFQYIDFTMKSDPNLSIIF